MRNSGEDGFPAQIPFETLAHELGQAAGPGHVKHHNITNNNGTGPMHESWRSALVGLMN